MWAAVVIIIGSLLCAMLIVFSVGVGFTFFVVPIVVADLMLIVAVLLMRWALASEKDVVPDRQFAWYVARNQSPPRAAERLGERPRGRRGASGRDNQGESGGYGLTPVGRSGQAQRSPRPVRRTRSP